MFTEKVGRLLLDLHFTRTFKKSTKSGDFAERGENFLLVEIFLHFQKILITEIILGNGKNIQEENHQ